MGQIHESACIVAHLPESLRCSAKLCRGALDDRRSLEGERGRQQQLAAGLPSRGWLQTDAAAAALEFCIYRCRCQHLGMLVLGRLHARRVRSVRPRTRRLLRVLDLGEWPADRVPASLWRPSLRL